jgi:hypothetical protein
MKAGFLVKIVNSKTGTWDSGMEWKGIFPIVEYVT